MERIKKHDIVKSFKREFSAQGMEYIYEVLEIGKNSETNEKMVVYKALYPPYDIWVRPYDMFMGQVDQEKYPNVRQQYRFECVTTDFCRKDVYPQKESYNFLDLKMIIEMLRSKDGCPWDRKQTFESMKKCLIDETQEVLDAVDHQDMDNLCEELGDVLLQVVMNSQIASEDEIFTLEDVVDGVAKKLIRRHPHVFGDEKVDESPEKAREKWEEMKKREKM